MQIKSIHLHPFGKFIDQKIEFSKPFYFLAENNEWGKSTLFNAIQTVLFTEVNLPPQKQNQAIGRFFPLPQGDVIRITIQFTIEGKGDYYLQKEWIKSKSGTAKLILPNSNEISDSATIQKELEIIIPITRSIFKNILSAPQSELHLTFDSFQKDAEINQQLGDILKKNLLEAGNFSVEKFKSRLEEKIAEYSEKWDFSVQYPENNKGINNPYQKGHGLIVKKYYAKEEMRIKLDQATKLESELERAATALDQIHHNYSKVQADLDRFLPLEQGLRIKDSKNSEFSDLLSEQQRIIKITQQWALLQNSLPGEKGKIQNLETEKQELILKQVEAQSYNSLIQKKEHFERLTRMRENLERAEIKLKNIPKNTREDLEAFRALKAKEEILKTAEMQIDLERKSSHKMILKTKNGEEIVVGEKLLTQAPGSFQIIAEDFSLEVKAGDISIDSIWDEIKMLREKIKGILEVSEENLLQGVKNYEKVENEYKQAKSSFNEVLNGEVYEVLQMEMLKVKLPEVAPNLQEINQKISLLDSEIIRKKIEFENNQKTFDQYLQEFGTYENLVVQSGEISLKLKKLGEELNTLPDLPENFQTFIEFSQNLEQLRSKSTQLTNEKYNQLNVFRQIESQVENLDSAEECHRLYEIKKQEFEQILAEGKALHVIKEKSDRILNDIQNQTNESLTKQFLKWLAPMVGEYRFQNIDIQENSPVSYNELGYELLSHGTKDVLALAWRLTLAEYFLGENSGMIILDDPMVDMDINRQKNVAATLKEFSKKHQVIYFTCHENQKAYFE